MNKNNGITTKKEIRNKFIFKHTNPEEKKEIYFCNCGEIIEKEISDVSVIKVENSHYSFDLNIEKLLESSEHSTEVICPKCEKNYLDSKVYETIVSTDKHFSDIFSFEENEISLILYKNKLTALYNKDNSEILLEEKKSYISFNKTNRKLKYFNELTKEEYYFTLDKVLETVNKFLKDEKETIIYNIIEVHRFINRTANFVVDSNNFNLVEELLKEMYGKAGIDILGKIISIFFGIITYSNLSTIALTKGLNFLYDMMHNCKLPDPSVLSDNNVTSPVKIFNFLVNLENKEIQERIDQYNPDIQKYLFKSNYLQYSLGANKNQETEQSQEKYDIKRLDNLKGKVHVGKDGLKIREDLTDKQVSSFVFKKIKNFKEYKSVIQYIKFIEYRELIALLMNYDINLLINLFPIIEFRDDVTLDRLIQFLHLAKDYAKRVQSGGSKQLSNDNYLQLRYRELTGIDENENNNKFKEYKKNIKDEDVKYSLIKTFDFTIFDDSLRMINDIKWDANKEFYKIKDIDELEDYHNKLVKHFNMLADKEKNANFKNFVAKFKYLEEYDGDLKIRIISSPDELLKESQELHNCAASYINRISREQYVLSMMYDLSNDENKETDGFMIGLHFTKYGLEFDQLKSKYNRQGTNKFKKQVMKYLESKDVSYKELADLKINEELKMLKTK
jgi:hypothetical protein